MPEGKVSPLRLHRTAAVCRLVFVLLFFLPASWLCADNYALLVGINTYPNVRQLKGAVADIVAIRAVVRDELKFPDRNIKVLLNEEATKANILAALDALAAQTRAGDTVLWYYSGHGWVQQDENGDEALGDPDDKYDEVLVPYDAVPWPRDRALDPNPTMVVDDEIGARLSRLAGRRLLIIFDSCHSGTATRALPGEEQTRALYENYALPPTPRTRSLKRNQETLDVPGQTVFIAAASPIQAASDLGEFDGKRHGAFTAGLLRAIREAGPDWRQNTTLEQLFRTAREDMINHGFSTQTPSLAARDGLARVPVERLLRPPAASELAQVQTSGTFNVRLAANKYQFEEGELLELMVESERDGYLYLFDINSEQAVTQLLPNRFCPDNQVFANAPRSIPAALDKYQWRAGPPFGRGRIVAIVTSAPWERANRLDLPLGFQPISDAQRNGLRDSLRDLLDSVNTGEKNAAQPAWASQKIVVELFAKGGLPAEGESLPESQPAPPTATAAPAARPDSTAASSTPAAAAPPLPTAAVPAAPPVPAPAAPPVPAPASALSFAPAPASTAASPVNLPGAPRSLDDTNLAPADQANLPRARPQLFKELEKLAQKFAPVFWQDVSGEFDRNFLPWRDFFVRYDFDTTTSGPNWPEPPRFQDEMKRARNGSLNALLTPSPERVIEEAAQTPGVFKVSDKRNKEAYELDLRPVVYWAVLTTPSHYFFHYVAFHAEDWKPLFGHTGDLEGTTIVVDRQTEQMVAAFTLAHDDVGVVRGLDDETEANIGVLVNPSAESRGLFDGDDGRPVDGSLAMEAGRGDAPAPKEHQDIYVESRGHGQYGPHKIRKSRYILYANFLDESTWRAPSFDRRHYPLTDRFSEVASKHKYRLVYIGAAAGQGPAAGDKSLWGEYRTLRRFSGGANPPWDWRDNLFFKTGWWKDPRMIKKIGAEGYRINPYLLGDK